MEKNKSKNQKSDTIKAVIYVDNAINMKFSEIEALFIKSIIFICLSIISDDLLFTQSNNKSCNSVFVQDF